MQEEIRFKFITDKLKNIVQKDEEKFSPFPEELSVDEIMPNPYQPRRHFDISSLEELSQSIKEVGVIAPISVRRAACGYELICGERRLRAAKMAGLKTIPAVVKSMTDAESAIAAITENLQRKNLNFFEEAESMNSLVEFHKMTQEKVAEKLGKSQASVANKMRLLKLPDSVRRIVTEGNLCERHARALLRLPTEEMQTAAAKRAVEFQMNVSSTEKMIQKMLEEEPKKKMFKKENTSYEKMCFLFRNTVNKTIDMMRKGGMKPSVTENEQDDYIEYVIRLSK